MPASRRRCSTLRAPPRTPACPPRSPTNCSAAISARRRAPRSAARTPPCNAPRCCAKRCGAWSPSSISTRPASTTSPTPPKTSRGSRRRSTPIATHLRKEPLMSLADACRDRRHRRRHHRLLDGLSSGARPQGRRGAARTGQAHLGLDLACGGAGRAIALVGVDHPRAQIFGRSLQAARRRDRACHRLEDDRLPAGSPPTRIAGPNSAGWRRRRKASAWTCI